MIEIQFPDQSVRIYPKGTTPFEIASSISEGLARNVLSAKFNEQIVESVTPLHENGKIGESPKTCRRYRHLQNRLRDLHPNRSQKNRVREIR